RAYGGSPADRRRDHGTPGVRAGAVLRGRCVRRRQPHHGAVGSTAGVPGCGCSRRCATRSDSSGAFWPPVRATGRPAHSDRDHCGGHRRWRGAAVKREPQNMVLLLVGVSIAVITATGAYTRYVKPGMWPWLSASAIALIALALSAIARDVRAGRATEHGG